MKPTASQGSEATAWATQAAERLEALRVHVQAVKKVGHPAPGRVPFFASCFWLLQDPDRWPVYWSSCVQTLRAVGWLTVAGDRPRTTRSFVTWCSISAREPDVSYALDWWAKYPFVGLDPTLLERVERVLALNEAASATRSYRDEDDRKALEACARSSSAT